MKKYIITIMVTAILSLCICSVPDAYYDSLPTANTTKMTKVTHTDCVNADGEILKIVGKNPFVKIGIKEEDISKIKVGQKAVITGTAFPDNSYSGYVDEIASCATKQYIGAVEKTVVLVNVEITNGDDNIKSGYSAKVRIYTSEPDTLNIVPYEAVNQDDNGEFVYVFSNGVAIRKDIETGLELGDGIEITDGIDNNDTILEYDDKIQDGKPVIIKE